MPAWLLTDSQKRKAVVVTLVIGLMLVATFVPGAIGFMIGLFMMAFSNLLNELMPLAIVAVIAAICYQHFIRPLFPKKGNKK